MSVHVDVVCNNYSHSVCMVVSHGYPVHYTRVAIHDYHVAVAACVVVTAIALSVNNLMHVWVTPTYELMAEMVEKQASLYDWNWT